MREVWAEAQKLFRYPTGKPRLRGAALHSVKDGAAVAGNMLVKSWRNPINAQARRRSIYYHVIPRVLELGRPVYPPVYTREVAFDDWSSKFHEALTRKIGRRGGDWCWIDDFGSRGCCVYFSNVAVDGFKLLESEEDVRSAFADALNGIRPPAGPLPATACRCYPRR